MVVGESNNPLCNLQILKKNKKMQAGATIILRNKKLIPQTKHNQPGVMRKIPHKIVMLKIIQIKQVDGEIQIIIMQLSQ